MSQLDSPDDQVDHAQPARAHRSRSMLGISLAILIAAGAGYFIGNHWRQPAPMETLRAATAAMGANMAVATGAVSDDTEGVFFLDFLTGDLQCLVYYPRLGGFGARYYTNVLANLPASGKNSQYLLVTGGAVTTRATAGARPGNSLVYVTDATSGNFAAYAVPWDRTSEGASRAQSGPLVFVGGGPIRNYQVRDSRPNAPANPPATAPANVPDNPANKAAKQSAKAPDKPGDRAADKKAKPANKTAANPKDDAK